MVSRKFWFFILKNKNEVFERFRQWKFLVEKQTRRKVKRLRTDNRLEFCAEIFNNFCKDEGIARNRIIVETPQQNGLVERFNKTIPERVKRMLINAGLSKTFWAEAIVTKGYLINKCPSAALNFKTPKEVWSGQKQ